MAKPRPADPHGSNQLLLALANDPIRWLLFLSFRRPLRLPLGASMAASSGFSAPPNISPFGFECGARRGSAGPEPSRAAPSLAK